MSTDPVTAAVERLQREFPALAAAVMPRFEAQARRAVAKLGVEGVHERPLNLFTTIETLDWSPTSPSILAALDAQVRALRDVPKAEEVYLRLAECEGGTMLSTISELAFATHLRKSGAELTFNVKYRLTSGGKVTQPDVDILATWSWGSVAFDVYSPRKELVNTDSGFLSLRPDGLADVVADKVRRKFGEAGAVCDGLPADTLKVIAVDTAYNGTAFVGLHSPLGKVREEMLSMSDLRGADAVLMFTHYQHAAGHPVAVHGILYGSPRCAPLYKAFGLTKD